MSSVGNQKLGLELVSLAPSFDYLHTCVNAFKEWEWETYYLECHLFMKIVW